MRSKKRIAKKSATALEKMQNKAKIELKKAKIKFMASEKKVKAAIKNNPGKALAIAAAIGAALGAAVMAVVSKKKKR